MGLFNDGKFGTTLFALVGMGFCNISLPDHQIASLVPTLIQETFIFLLHFCLYSILCFGLIFQFTDWNPSPQRYLTPSSSGGTFLLKLSIRFSTLISLWWIGTIFGFTIELLTRRIESRKSYLNNCQKEKQKPRVKFFESANQSSLSLQFNQYNILSD